MGLDERAARAAAAGAAVTAGPRIPRPFSFLYVASICFTCSFWAQVLLVPLFALQHGYSLSGVGLLAAVTGLLQLSARLVAGPLADAWGEVPVIRLCYAVSLLGALPLLLPHPPLAGLVAAEVGNGIGRGMYWIAAQSYTTQLPGDRSALIGRLQGTSFIGAFVALLSAGAASQAFGYRATFGGAAVLAAAAVAISLLLMRARSRRATRGDRPLARYGDLLRRRGIRLAASYAFASAVPYALVTSFFPAYALHIGLPRALATPAVALCNLSSLVATGLMTWYLARLGRGTGLTLASLALAAALGGVTLGAGPVPFLAAVALAGLAGGILSPFYQVLAAEASRTDERGAALSVTGLFWSLGMLVVPAVFGLLAQQWGFGAAFAAWALGELVLAVVGALAYRRAVQGPEPAGG